METSEQKDAKKKPKKKGKQEKSTGRWAVQVFFIAVILSAVLSFASDQALDGAGIGVAFAVLLAFILLGIVFDIIGVSVTAADEKPFHSMAARKTPGAREAIGLTSYLYKGVDAGGWTRDDRGWRYRDPDGRYYRNTTVTVDGKRYTLDRDGYTSQAPAE